MYIAFFHAKTPTQKSVLLAPRINKYTNNDLKLGDPRDYFCLYGKYLPEFVKS